MFYFTISLLHTVCFSSNWTPQHSVRLVYEVAVIQVFLRYYVEPTLETIWSILCLKKDRRTYIFVYRSKEYVKENLVYHQNWFDSATISS